MHVEVRPSRVRWRRMSKVLNSAPSYVQELKRNETTHHEREMRGSCVEPSPFHAGTAQPARSIDARSVSALYSTCEAPVTSVGKSGCERYATEQKTHGPLLGH